MNGYTGYKFGEAMPYNPFGAGGSTFTGANPPSYLGGLASLASPEEWRTQGTAFIQNPQMLKTRFELEQLGRQRGLQSQMDVIREQIMSRMSESLSRPRFPQLEAPFEQPTTMPPQPAPRPTTNFFQAPVSQTQRQLVESPTMRQRNINAIVPSWMQNYQSPQFPRY